MDYSKKNKKELIKLCKELKIKRYSRNNKDILIKMLTDQDDLKDLVNMQMFYKQWRKSKKNKSRKNTNKKRITKK